jgi:hypothetical protein
MTRKQARELAWVLGGFGILGAAVGWSTDPAAFPHAWLAAFVVWLQWPVGCLGLILIHALTGGRWGYVLRGPLLAGLRSSVWLLIPAALPWLLMLAQLYPWARPDVTGSSNAWYLNRPFFIGRVAGYFIVWLALRALTLRALRRPEPDPALARIAPGGLIALMVTITFGSIDFTMSLDPHFDSSVYGLITVAETGLFALAVAVFAAALAEIGAPDVRQILGKLLIGLVLLWAYLDFMQLLISWESDLPTDAHWYLIRRSGIWGAAETFTCAAHFILPWCALIWPPLRRSRLGLALVTGLLVLSAVVRGWWLVLPASGVGFTPTDVAAMLCLLGIGAALSLREPPAGRSVPLATEAAGGRSNG